MEENNISRLGHLGASLAQPEAARGFAEHGGNARPLRCHIFRHPAIPQAIRQKHSVPGAVGVAVAFTVAGVAMAGSVVVQDKVPGAFPVAQLGLCHGQKVGIPDAGAGVGGVGAEGFRILHIRGQVRQAGFVVGVLRDGAGERGLPAGIRMDMGNRCPLLLGAG